MKASMDIIRKMIQQGDVFKLPVMRTRDGRHIKDYKYYKLDICHFCGDSCFKRLDSKKDTFGYCNRQCQMSCSDQRKKQGKALSRTRKEYPELYKEAEKKAAKTYKITALRKAKKRVAKWKKEGKKCSKCGEVKPLSEYWLDKRTNSCIPVQPTCKLRCTMGQRISASLNRKLKGIKQRRRDHWETLLGYTVDDLMRRLEKFFKPGMSWSNYGDWHLDHIIPLAVFNFETVDDIDFKRAWALTNLQPLWAGDNYKKGAKLEKPFQPSLAFAVNQ